MRQKCGRVSGLDTKTKTEASRIIRLSSIPVDHSLGTFMPEFLANELAIRTTPTSGDGVTGVRFYLRNIGSVDGAVHICVAAEVCRANRFA